jgi:hypothetical protein
LSSTIAASASRHFKFQKRSQLFIGVHDQTLSIVAMRVSNPDRSPVPGLLGRTRTTTQIHSRKP